MWTAQLVRSGGFKETPEVFWNSHSITRQPSHKCHATPPLSFPGFLVINHPNGQIFQHTPVPPAQQHHTPAGLSPWPQKAGHGPMPKPKAPCGLSSLSLSGSWGLGRREVYSCFLVWLSVKTSSTAGLSFTNQLPLPCDFSGSLFSQFTCPPTFWVFASHQAKNSLVSMATYCLCVKCLNQKVSPQITKEISLPCNPLTHHVEWDLRF